MEWARGTLDAAAQLVAGTQALQSEHKTQINIGASMTVAEYLVPAWLGEFRRRYPHVDVSLQVHNSKDVFELVQRGRIAVGFVETPDIPHGLGSTVIANDRLIVVTDSSHPGLSAKDLSALPNLQPRPSSFAKRAREPGTRWTNSSGTSTPRLPHWSLAATPRSE